MHVAAVDPDSHVRAGARFGTFTEDLHDLADWFKACGVTRSRWNPPGSTGFRPSKFLRSAGSRYSGQRTRRQECAGT